MQDGPRVTVPEAARRLGVSESTIRNWLKALGDLIAAETGPDGYRHYSLRALERVAAMREEFDLPLSAIRAGWSDEGAEPEPTESYQDQHLALLERIADAVERIATYFEGNEPPER